MKNKSIGIIGGVGPYAGLSLAERIFANTNASTDQEHIPLFLLNLPAIPDRSAYLLDLQNAKNPEPAFLEGIAQLELLKASCFAIPCNTAHAPRIINPILREVEKRKYHITFVHLIATTLKSIVYTGQQTTGLLATLGTYHSAVYSHTAQEQLGGRRLDILLPANEQDRQLVHDAIYNPVYGIKAQSKPIDSRAIAILNEQANKLVRQGAQSIVLGCTEISLARDLLDISVSVIDPLDVLARELIAMNYPERLIALP